MSRDRRARTDRSTLRWILPVMALVVSLGLSYGAYRLASYSWDQVVSYQSPYTSLDGNGPMPAEASPRRVVLVLIDGLRDDASRTMSSISGLRARGADVRLTVPEPSLSYPTWTTALSGAPQQISGVTTNWFEGPVAVETLLDVASAGGRTVVVSGTDDLDMMFRASEVTTASALIAWDEDGYTSDIIVDNALELDRQVGGSDFVFVLLPDVDNVGHDFGGASRQYAEVVAQVDADLSRLIEGLDDGQTTFVVLPDHGHIDTGGHGGWEEPVVRTFAAFAGPGVANVSAEAHLADVAPTVAVLAGLPAPRQAVGTAIEDVLADENGDARDAEGVRAAGVTLAYVERVLGAENTPEVQEVGFTAADLAYQREVADAQRLDQERGARQAILIGAVAAVGVFVVFLGLTSWRALVASIVGGAAYVGLYNALFFGLHRLTWSLSAFNEETLVDAFFNQRMLEAAIAGLFGCLVAALTYGALRKAQGGPRSGNAVEWLALGGAVVVFTQALLVLQIATFLWRWGADVTWILPDMREAFKYDLDLIQLTALAAAAFAGPLVTWLVGRLLPRARAAQS